MRKQSVIFVVMLALALMLAACGGPEPTATPLPSDTPAPTNTPAPTQTPEPTVDLTALTAPEIYATIAVLEEDLAYEEDHLFQASGAESGSVQSLIDQLKTEISELTALAEAAEAAEGED